MKLFYYIAAISFFLSSGILIILDKKNNEISLSLLNLSLIYLILAKLETKSK